MENNQKSIGVQTDYENNQKSIGVQTDYEMLKEEAVSDPPELTKEQRDSGVAYLRGTLESKAPLSKVCSLKPHWRVFFFFIMPCALILAIFALCAFTYKTLIPCLLWSGKSWHTMPLFLLTLSLIKYLFQGYFALMGGWCENQAYLQVCLTESPIPEAHILILEWERKKLSRHEDRVGLLLQRAVLEKALARARQIQSGTNSQQSKLDRHQDMEAITMRLREVLQINENPNEPDGLLLEEHLNQEWLKGKMNTRKVLVVIFDSFWTLPTPMMAAICPFALLCNMHLEEAGLVIVPDWVGMLYVALVHFFLDVFIVYKFVSVRRVWQWAMNE